MAVNYWYVFFPVCDLFCLGGGGGADMRGGSRYDMDFGGPLYPFSSFVRAVGKANAKGE